LLGVREALVAHLQLDHQTHTQRSRTTKKSEDKGTKSEERERDEAVTMSGSLKPPGPAYFHHSSLRSMRLMTLSVRHPKKHGVSTNTRE
jgi:hypothetical protein